MKSNIMEIFCFTVLRNEWIKMSYFIWMKKKKWLFLHILKQTILLLTHCGFDIINGMLNQRSRTHMVKTGTTIYKNSACSKTKSYFSNTFLTVHLPSPHLHLTSVFHIMSLGFTNCVLLCLFDVFDPSGQRLLFLHW